MSAITMNPINDQMLTFIRDFISGNGYPPTYEEIRAALNLSTKSMVAYHLDQLEMAGCIAREAGRARTIRLVA